MDIPRISVEEMRRIDELAVKHFGIETLQMMENAGRAVASLAREVIGVRGRIITVLCGKGNNGGDGLVAARFLSNWGATVNIILASHPDELSPVVKDHYGSATSMHMNRLTAVDNIQWELAMKQSDLIIDGLIGYNLKGNPEGSYAELINLANHSGKKILSIDCPSGLDSDTGERMAPCITAEATLALTLPKKGLFLGNAKSAVGKVFCADVGVPHEVFELMGLKVPKIFEKKDILKL